MFIIMPDILLIVGHSPRSPGARNLGPTMEPGDDLYEYHFNRPIVKHLLNVLKNRGVDAAMDLYQPRGGNVARWNGASKLLIEFHCNAFDRMATGTEVLYAAGSVKGEVAADIMQDHLVAVLGLPSRGSRPKVRSDRGGYLLWGVSQVTLIPEPFFIDNDADLATARKTNLVTAYADAIEAISAEIL